MTNRSIPCRLALAFVCALFCWRTALFAEDRPVRIVSLSPGLTEFVCALGGSDRLVGRSSACDRPASVVASVPACGDFARPNVEAILRLRPTHLVTNDLIDPGVRRVFERAGIRTTVRQCRTIEDCQTWIRTLGAILNEPDAARREEERFEAFRKEAAALPRGKRRVLWTIWESPTIVAGPRSLPDEVLRLCGAENVAANADAEYFKCSRDWIVRNEPDVLIWSAAPRDWKDDRFWGRLRATRTGRVLLLRYDDPALRPGPRLPDAVRELRARLEALP